MNRVFIRTYGCQMNERESEALAALLVERGYQLTSTEADADIILLNSCSVRALAEEKALGKAGHLLKKRKRIVGVFGCMAQNRPGAVMDRVPRLSLVVGTQRFQAIPDYLDALQKDPTCGPIIDVAEDATSQEALGRHLVRGVKASAFVSIMQGCNMRCAYCIVPKTRGVERSRPIDAIIREVEQLAAAGVREVMLLGQIVTSYGRREIPAIAGKSPFVQLLEKLEDIKGIERIRFTSPHPSGFRDDLIEAYGSLRKLCPYAHLPLQSGSDTILRAMNRPYTAEKFEGIVQKLRERVPGICLSTDVIVGFPGETEEDFQMTHEVFTRSAFGMAYIFKYSPRADTPAYPQGDPIPEEVKEARNQALLEVLTKDSLLFNRALIGTHQEVLVEGLAKKGGVYWGRNPSFRKVLFPGNPDLIGKFVKVDIQEATVSTVSGQVVAEIS